MVKLNKKKPAVAKRQGFNYYEAKPSRDHASLQTRNPFMVKLNKKKPAVAKRQGFNYYEANPSRDHASLQTRNP